jgi:magnesium chelatase family protein
VVKIVYIMLMIGTPGTAKTMLPQRLPTILPPLTPGESLETTRIYSAMGRLRSDEPLLTVRPFRPPHHTISDVSA